MNHSVLAQRIRCLTTLALRRAEGSEDEATLSAKQDAAVRRTLERLGVEVGPHGVRMRARDNDVVDADDLHAKDYLPAASEQS